jgi:hypothetical protein
MVEIKKAKKNGISSVTIGKETSDEKLDSKVSDNLDGEFNGFFCG